MRSIAIIGAGYAGLAACWHLLQIDPRLKITIFAEDLKKSASYSSTGLLHPYPGEHGRRTSFATEALQAAVEILQVAEGYLNRPVFTRTGVFRPALQEDQRISFQKALQYDDVEWWDEKKTAESIPGVCGPGLFIKSGMTVFSSLYVEGLILACQSKGAKIVAGEIRSLEDLKDFDQVVIAAGFGCLNFPECQKLPLSITKGQALLCKWKKPLPCSVSGKGHISLTNEQGLCLIGSTYERGYISKEADLSKAIVLKEQVGVFCPSAREWEVVKCLSGLRIARKGGYLPLLERLNQKTWVFTGLGSRGLIYHALYGKQLASQITA